MANQKNVRWTRPPKVGVIKLILGVIFMVKYDEEFKLKLVNDYLDSDLSYVSLAKKYDIPSPSSIKNWVRAYKSQGVEGLKRKKRKSKKKAVYSVQFKLDVVQFVLETRASFPQAAKHFNLNRSALVASWFNAFQKAGIGGLKPKGRGRSSMPKKPSHDKNNEANHLTPNQELVRENELLRLENAYLKKLKAFRENPNAFHEKFKQKWHSNSKKKDSD